MTHALNISVTKSWPIVIHFILEILLLKSFIYNSAPAEKAIIAKAMLLRKFSFGNVSVGIKFKKDDPAMIPVTIKPVTNGNLIFWKNFAI